MLGLVDLHLAYTQPQPVLCSHCESQNCICEYEESECDVSAASSDSHTHTHFTCIWDVHTNSWVYIELVQYLS